MDRGVGETNQTLADVRVTVVSLADFLLGACDRGGDREVLVFPEARLSYAERGDRAMLRARQLWAAGVRPRDHVGILLPTSVQFVETLFAVALCGASSILLNARYKAPEIAYVAEDADLTTIVSTAGDGLFDDFTDRLAQAFPDIAASGDRFGLRCAAVPRLRTILLLGDRAPTGFAGLADVAGWMADIDDGVIHVARVGIRVRDPAMILYTSGTSASPKGCLISHEAVTREAAMIAERWTYTAADRVWSPLPLFHVAALSGLLAIMSAGGTFIGMLHFDPDDSVRMVEREGATSLFLPFVTFLQAMMQSPAFEDADLSRVRHVNSCFAAQPKKVGETWVAKAPHIQHVGTFGMTEVFGIASTGGGDMDPALGFARLGWPLRGTEVRIIDPDTGADRPVGERGEVLVRGFSLFDGYYKDVERSATALDADGWYHSGDIGSLDAAGHVMFHGRFKDMLKVGGENVAAAEVEAVLAEHPAVKLAQVVGVPDDRLVEIPAAFVEMEGGTATPEELIGFVRERLAAFVG